MAGSTAESRPYVGKHFLEPQRSSSGGDNSKYAFPPAGRSGCDVRCLFLRQCSDHEGAGDSCHVGSAGWAIRPGPAIAATRTATEPQESATLDSARYCALRQGRQEGSARCFSPGAGEFAGLSACVGRGGTDRIRERGKRRDCSVATCPAAESERSDQPRYVSCAGLPSRRLCRGGATV